MSDSDKEHEIPVKVVDRRWWANADAASSSSGSAATSLKPTYVEELEQKVAEKDKQIQEYLTKYRQASSEFDEMRLRLRREISKDVERARRDVISELLEVLDNLERALDAARSRPSGETLLQGVDMVRRQFLSKLEALGVKPIDSADARFDPALHEAVSTVPAATPEQDGKVIGVVRQGYRIGDEVLRPAAVAVAKISMQPVRAALRLTFIRALNTTIWIHDAAQRAAHGMTLADRRWPPSSATIAPRTTGSVGSTSIEQRGRAAATPRAAPATPSDEPATIGMSDDAGRPAG